MTRSAMQMGRRLTLVVCVLLLLLLTTQACFIRDCPKGGKRDVEAIKPTKPCMSCSFGQCVGPYICCGDTGCEMGTPEAIKCAKEDEDPTPCLVIGSPCTLNNPGNTHGNCVSFGMCCVDDTCSIESGCP
uniref:Conotoxin n=1 Tax=Conus praecellens TaxID=128530 RepID=A0A291C2D4_CONPC|nr:conotoxin [Conus praecellens]